MIFNLKLLFKEGQNDVKKECMDLVAFSASFSVFNPFGPGDDAWQMVA
jgi:hypothetical protein